MVATIDELLEMDSILFPNYVGDMPTNYRESCYAYTLRVWEWLEKSDIEPGDFETVSELEAKHEGTLLQIAEGMGLTTTNAPAAQAEALEIFNRGYDEWFMDAECEVVEWEPTTDFEWTARKEVEDAAEQAPPGSIREHNSEALLNNDEVWVAHSVDDDIQSGKFFGSPSDAAVHADGEDEMVTHCEVTETFQVEPAYDRNG